MAKFIPRPISKASAQKGYNNQGRGRLIGYISDPKQHEASCPHRKDVKQTCACRIGLWQEEVQPQQIKTASKRGGPTKGPFLVEDHDNDDGGKAYEIWTYDMKARVLRMTDDDNPKAKADAELIVRLLNNQRPDPPTKTE